MKITGINIISSFRVLKVKMQKLKEIKVNIFIRPYCGPVMFVDTYTFIENEVWPSDHIGNCDSHED